VKVAAQIHSLAMRKGPALLSDVPEVKTYIRTHPMYGGAVLTYNKNNGDPVIFREGNIQMVDSTFMDVFSYTVIQGNLETCLDKPTSVVMTESMAKKYFGNEKDYLGKVLKMAGSWMDGDYEVTAVIKDVPENSTFPFDFVFPLHNVLRNPQYKQDNGWGWNNFVTYIQLHPNTDLKTAEGKLPAFIDKYRGKDLAESNGKLVLNFQPIRDIHLKPGYNNESSATISVDTIYFFTLISIFILAIAWINYINLSTARAMERAHEVGIKKAIGAFKSQLISQFFFESILVNFIGVVLAAILAIGLLPVLGDIVGKELTFDFSDYRFWAVLAGLFILGAFVSGGYPALVLSSFQTIEVLKGKNTGVRGGFPLRKVLVVFQFAASLILIAGTFAVYRQLNYMQEQDKGMTLDQMLVFEGPSVLDGGNRRDRLMTVKNRLSEIPGVEKVSTSAAIPGGGYNWGARLRKDGTPPEENKSGSICWVDSDFIDTYGLTLVSGRKFNPEIRSDMEAIMVNEAALTAYGLGDAENALNERIILGNDTIAIIGVLKNYNWSSLKEAHSPWMLKTDTVFGRYYSLHLTGNNVNAVVNQVENLFKESFPGNPFDYYFMDDFFDKQYKAERQFAEIFGLFAVLAIVIACLGLWGLASFTTSQKLKEIGIRKVLGASAGSITSLLSMQFLKLILIASVIALPLTWYGIDSWLGGFAFRIGLRWDLFVVPVVVLTIIALGTVSVQIMRGASINPAKVLRSE
jgi:putative ABC transport system permease protein